ncbi:MAG: acyloxyacyl hydrolase [Chlorobium sp.]|uniref:outer membrane protein n=1 Tax=Chlorobium sp. TaxID=1095 RepID=UPI001D6D2BA5|nr:acyloxyacyl hydrolase [Chlorobium sp.]MBN1279084.1 porin family protein [Chlorobiaceae bacterium]MCF8215420.1 acyloxyacyl hydrolase [Chlorobium sp.]MCF8270258.1 acyloxyacyl hydrolase [Chlorobium sp.]MCF8286627.1 acyloxyacyl hydrolase [Chlorobium sp.]MCF8290227.1 acyloxyacyl hydrolase [Chlorobium sp.]
MIRVLRGLFFVLILFFFGTASADSATPYVGGSTGFAFLNGDKLTLNGTYLADPEYDTGAAFSGSLGMDYDGYRVEGEVAYQKNEIDNLGSDVSVLSFMANGYLDFQMERSRIIPFVSAGVSYAKVDVDTLGDDGSDGVFAFQLGAGAGFQISSRVTIDAKYRYFASADPEIELGQKKYQMDINSHNLLFGFRMSF